MVIAKQLIADNIIWSKDGRWYSLCTNCNKERSYKNLDKVCTGIRNKTVCRSCSKSGNKHPYYGKPGARKGCIISEEIRNKQSVSAKNKPSVTDETKAKLRQNALNQWKTQTKLGFKPAVDYRATEFFHQVNTFEDKHIVHPNVRIEGMRFFADGYDPIEHIVYEFDTAYHLQRRYQLKDLERQNKIIQHFNKVGKPLNDFIRINATGVGQFGSMISVLGK